MFLLSTQVLVVLILALQFRFLTLKNYSIPGKLTF